VDRFGDEPPLKPGNKYLCVQFLCFGFVPSAQQRKTPTEVKIGQTLVWGDRDCCMSSTRIDKILDLQDLRNRVHMQLSPPEPIQTVGGGARHATKM
jgi:hypothetical protein